jgi:site-specific recombinase XerD
MRQDKKLTAVVTHPLLGEPVPQGGRRSCETLNLERPGWVQPRESEQTFTAYPTRTVQKIFTDAKNRAGINKTVGIHVLRHRFATHLLEKGVDIHFIKELLGHFDIKTTERYLHVSNRQLANIVSPLDDMWKRGQIEL